MLTALPVIIDGFISSIAEIHFDPVREHAFDSLRALAAFHFQPTLDLMLSNPQQGYQGY